MSVEKRMIIAVVLSAAFIIVWNLLIMPPPPIVPEEEQTGEEGKEAEGEKSEEAVRHTESQGEEAAAEPPPEKPEEQPKEPVFAEAESTVVVESELYRVELTNQGGGCVKSWVLKNYEASYSSEPLDLVPPEKFLTEWNGKPIRPLVTMIREIYTDRTKDPEETYPYYNQMPKPSKIDALTAGGELIFDEKGEAKIRFEYNGPEVGWIVKELTFHEDSYIVDVGFKAYLERRQDEAVIVWGPGIGEMLRPKDGGYERGYEGVGFIFRPLNDPVTHVSFAIDNRGWAAAPFAERALPTGEMRKFEGKSVVWAGMENSYFMAMAFTELGKEFFPVYALTTDHALEGKSGEETTEISYYFPYLAIKPKNQDSNFRMFVGPKDLELLEATAEGRLQDVVQFGLFGFISRPGLWLLNQINNVVGNYGWSIILLTILINTLMLPLILKQRKSMVAMQKLQPQIKQTQNKYKAERGDSIEQRQNKKKALNEELMALYKAEGVNPMGGCLPLLLQLPILIALFDMIRVAIVLRKAPFIFWIDNLVEPDLVLVILMGAVMYAGQLITPTTTEAGGATMKLLPLLFVFFFISAYSGLVLYWLTSSLYSLGTQLAMNAVNPPATPASKKKSPTQDQKGKKIRRR